MKRYILFSLLFALPLSLAAQRTIRRPSKPKAKPKVESAKPKPKSKPKQKSRPLSTSTPQSTPQAIHQSTPQSTPQAIHQSTPQAIPQSTPQPSPQPAPQITPQQAELNKLINNMVYVSGGTFTMGATREQGRGVYDDDKPTHSVTLSSFYLCKYEVTQALWRAVMGDNPSNFKGDNLPVEKVSWNDCQTFISRLNNLTGKNFRLPTESEWEYAARGGNRSRGYKYSGSKVLSDVAWFDDNSGSKTHPVGSKSPNELGLYDMSGNVWEWCSDWYGTYSSSSQTNPTGASSGSYRVFRGGSWFNDARYCRSSYRSNGAPVYRHFGLGLRLALSQI